jgi:hypothetical protein
MINFDDAEFIDYRNQLKNNFMFFRMFLNDDVDAIITHFISTGKISYVELASVYDGLYQALIKIVDRYPNKTAKSLDDKIKLAKGKNIHACDTFNHHIVFSLSQVLIYLLSETSFILSATDTDAN